MEDIIIGLVPQMPVVAVLLLMFWIIRTDVNAGINRMEARLDKLLDQLLKDDE